MKGLVFGGGANVWRLARSCQLMLRCKMSGEKSPERGAFILFEGVDRSGKTTQATSLVAALKERKVDAELWRFPDRTTDLGKIITSYLTEEIECQPDMVHLLFAANRMEKRPALLEKLQQQGVTIVMDRYCYSGAAFTMAKCIPGLDMEWCKSIERGKLPAPDQTYFLDLPVDVSEKRSSFGEERYEKREFQREVRKSFHLLGKGEGWTVIDATKPPDEIHEKIFEGVMTVVKECKKGSKDIRQVWNH